MRKMTSAQRWILDVARDGSRVEPGGMYEVHTDMRTHKVSYVAPSQAHAVCVRNGWLLDNRITEAGLAALSPSSVSDEQGDQSECPMEPHE